MGRLAVLVLAAVFAGAPGAPGARADVIEVGADRAASGPVIAGQTLVWAVRGPKTWLVRASTPSGTRELARLPSPLHFADDLHLSAEGAQVTAEVRAVYCSSGAACKYGVDWHVPVAVYAGTLDAGLARVGGCGVSRSCLRCSAGPRTLPAVAVSGGAVAVLDTCARTVTVTEPGGDRRAFAGRLDVRLGTGTVLSTLEDGVQSVVTERSSGRELVRFTGYQRALGPAGTVVWLESPPGPTGPQHVRAASPPDWSPRDLGPTGETTVLGVGDGRIALAGGSDVTVVREADGAVVAHAPLRDETADVPAFDGRRLAWAAHPCAVTSLVTWDVVEEAEPPRIPAICDPAVPVATDVRLRGARSFLVRMRCPSTSRAGCTGSLSLRRGRRDGPLLDRMPFDVPPGAQRRVRLRLHAGALRRLRHGPLRVVAVAHAEGGRRSATFRLRR